MSKDHTFTNVVKARAQQSSFKKERKLLGMKRDASSMCEQEVMEPVWRVAKQMFSSKIGCDAPDPSKVPPHLPVVEADDHGDLPQESVCFSPQGAEVAADAEHWKEAPHGRRPK